MGRYKRKFALFFYVKLHDLVRQTSAIPRGVIILVPTPKKMASALMPLA